MTLKVSDVAKKPEDEPNLEALLFKMISDGIIKAKFDKKQKMITFTESAQESGDQYLEVVNQLESQNKRIVELMQKVQEVDSKLKMSKKFLKKEMTGNLGGNGQSSGAMM